MSKDQLSLESVPLMLHLWLFVEIAIDTGATRTLVILHLVPPFANAAVLGSALYGWLVILNWIVDERTQIDARYS